MCFVKFVILFELYLLWFEFENAVLWVQNVYTQPLC
jgi:hypothetical protein